MECSEKDCMRPVWSSGLCAPHHRLWLIDRAPKCVVDGCDGKGWRTGGMCEKHYRAEKRKTAEQCSVDGCDRLVVAHGLCRPHYERQLYHGHIDPTRPKDWGGRSAHPLYGTWKMIRRRRGKVDICNEWLSDFWQFAKDMGEKPSSSHVFRRRDNSKPYRPDNCYWAKKEISGIRAKSTKEYMRLWHKQYRVNNPEKYRNYELKRRTGISAAEFDRFYKEQNGKCAICRKAEVALHPTTQKPRALAVDHCHEKGVIRGLLCSKCNTGIGSLNHDPKLLERAIEYLRWPMRLL